MKKILFAAFILLSLNVSAQLGLGLGVTDSVPTTNAKGAVVRQAPADLWRCSFASVGSGLLTTDVALLQTGSGMAVSQSAGNLVITTGTTANSETLIKSVKSFNGAFVARFKTILSQRIANNNFSYELADVIGTSLSYSITNSTTVVVTFGTNPFTSANVGQFVNMSVITGAAGIPGRYAIASVSGSTTTFTVAGWPASGSGTVMLWGWNYHRVLYNGTTATSALVDAQRKGWASGDATITVNTTASPGTVVQIQNDGSMVGYSDALVTSNAAYQFTGRGSRIENIPDPNDNLFLFIRVLNGTTAPASTTTLTTGFLSVEEVSNNKVFISGATQNGENFALPISVKGTPAVTITSGTITTVSTLSQFLASAAAADATANPTTTGARSFNMKYNGATWDMERANFNTTTGDAGAKTATFAGATQTNFNARGAIITVLCGTVTGTTPTMTAQLQWSPDAGTTWLNMGAASGTVTATGNTIVLQVYPTNFSTAGATPAALTTGATQTVQLNTILPRTWRLNYTITGTTPSFTITAAYVNYQL